VPIKAKLLIDQVMIAGSILILNIFQKEEVARTDEKAKRQKLFCLSMYFSIKRTTL
jgi:hypothetical protein